MRVIIAGGRNIKDYELVEQAVTESGFAITDVISGCAYGADKLGEQWAIAHNIVPIPMPAKWDDITNPNAIVKYNKWGKPYDVTAGYRRNEEMAKIADALILVYDGISGGSANMLEIAEKYGLQIYKKIINVEKYSQQKKANYQLEAKTWATDLIKNPKSVVLDTESCGGSANDEIIAIGIVRLHDGQVLFDSKLRPNDDVHFNWYATQVHGISEKQLSIAPKLSTVWAEIYEILNNNEVLAYNHTSDKRMIIQSATKYGLDIPEINWHCIMKRYKQHTLRSIGTNLTTACAEMNIKAGGHDAVQDALAAARLVWRISQGYKLSETSTENLQTMPRKNAKKA